MIITCPECQFAREVDESKIPAKSQVATCPKCKVKFKFRELPEEIVTQEEPAQSYQAKEKPAQPTQASLPINEEPPAPTFPRINAPGEDPKEELWDKLGDMTPPDGTEDKTEPMQAAEPEPRPGPQEVPAQKDSTEDQEPVPGWTGEFNNDFPDPMQDELGVKEEESSMLVPPPFEQLDRYGFFHGLFLTIKLILTSPRLFFSVMPVGGGLSKPLTFTILLTMIQGFVQYFWTLAGLSTYIDSSGGEQMAELANPMSPILMLLFMPAFIAAGQFLITGVYHLLLILMRADNQGFEGTFRALAYANAPIVLGLFPMPVSEIEIGWMFITAIWGLFLTITGLKYIHRTSYAKVVPVCLVPLLLAMIMGLAVFQNQLPAI